MAGDDHHRLAEGQQGEDGGVGQDELDVLPLDKAGLDGGRDGHEDDEHGDDAELAELEDQIGEAPGTGGGVPA